MIYQAANYSMGNKVQTIRFEADNASDARRIAERRMPTANALPGSHPMAAGKARVIGLKVVGR